MGSGSFIQSITAGQLRNEYILTAEGQTYIDIPGGNLLYAATGYTIWDTGLGLISRIGENYPQEWLKEISKWNIDIRGIKVIPEAIDHRLFTTYLDQSTASHDNPIVHFIKHGLTFPVSLLGYTNPELEKTTDAGLSNSSLRSNDIPPDYLDASSMHLCPLDFSSQVTLLTAVRHCQIKTITLQPSTHYMNQDYEDKLPGIVNGLTGFITNERDIMNLFLNRPMDLWEMGEAIARMGCEFVSIRGKNNELFLYDHVGKKRWIVPPYPSNHLDPIGVDDAYSGGFLAGFRKCYTPLESALYGVISSSFAVEGVGPFFGLHGHTDLAMARLENIRGYVRKV